MVMQRREFLVTAGLFALCGCGSEGSGGGGVIVVPGPLPAPQPSPAPAPTSPFGSVTIALAGSSSSYEYLTNYAGPPSVSQVSVSQDGVSFARLEVGAFGKAAGTEIARISQKQVRYLSGGAPGTTLAQWVVPDSSYRANLVRMLQRAGGADVVLLQIGRNDAESGVIASFEAQVALLQSLISAIRTEGNVANAMFFIGGSQEIFGGSANQLRQLGIQRQAETSVARNDAMVRFGFSTYDLSTRDNVHQTEQSQLISGARFAAQVAAYLNNQAESRGPRLLSARPVSDSEMFVELDAGSGSDIAPSSQISGFSILTNGQRLQILTSERVAPTQIRLVHAPRNGATAQLGYGLGGEINPSWCLRGNGSLQLPAEPTPQPFLVP